MEVSSYLEFVQKGMEDNIYNFCKDGKCSQCGNCCSNLLPMSRKEVDAIHRYIRKNHIKECKQFICDNEQRAKHNRALFGQTRQIIDVRSEFFNET